MIGKMINQIRTSKNISLTNLSKLTGIDTGHLSHIEKGERIPSHKTLKLICKALEVPYQQLMYSYDKTLNSNQIHYGIVNHISSNKVLAVDKIGGFIEIPSDFPSSAIAIKMLDNSMLPNIKKGDYLYVEFSSPLSNRDIGIFDINGEIVIRRFILSSGEIILRADNKEYTDIKIKEDDEFYIIGRILNA